MLTILSLPSFYLLISAVSPIFALATIGTARDSITMPPARQAILAPNRKFELVITPVNGDWRNMRSVGTLLELRSAVPEELWTRILPNRFRPKFAQVTRNGCTITFDDWDNVKSANAIVVYDPAGAIVRSYSFDQLMEALGIDPQVALDRAKPGLGWWMMGRPTQNRKSGDTEVAVAGRTLSIRACDGSVRLK